MTSTGFRLPNGAIRSPDGGWVRRDRLAALPAEERSGDPLLAGFVLDVRELR